MNKKYSIERFARSTRLGSLPQVSHRLVRLAQEADPTFDEAAKLISGDPALAGRILQTVNSPLFGLRKPVESVREALPKMGINMMRTHLLGFHLGTFSGQDADSTARLKAIWRHSISQAVIAQLISEEAKIGNPSVYFHIGMLQDVGMLAMLSEATDYYVENVLAHADVGRTVAAERSCFGFSHVEVSVAVAKRWGLSENALHGISRHHDVSLPNENSRRTDRISARVLFAANLAAMVLAADQSSSYPATEFHEYAKASFGFSNEQSANLIVRGSEQLASYVELFNVNADASTSKAMVLHEANQLLQKIALDAQLQLLGRDIEPANSVAARDHKIYIDPMTGTYNRRFLDEMLQDKLNDRRDTLQSLGILFFDVDDFKTINDTLGHAAGDKAITHVAKALASNLRKSDWIIRLGGDEFVVVVLEPTESGFASLSDTLQQSIPPLTLNGKTRPITLSSGAVFYEPPELREIFDIWEVIDRADQLMYSSKRTGGGRCTLARYDVDHADAAPIISSGQEPVAHTQPQG